MKRITLPFRIAVSAAALLATLTAVRAQQEGERDNTQALLSYRTLSAIQALVSASQSAAQQVQPAATPLGSRKGRVEKKTALKRVLLSMQNKEAEARATGVPGSDGDGITLLAESSVADAPVTPVTETTTASNVEVQLDKLVKELPRGTRWVKLMLPPTPKDKTLHGDDVADYALAQARMYGSVGEAVLPKGSVEVLSQPLASDKAKTVVPALNLRPVYLLLNPDAHVALMRGQNNNRFTSLPVEVTVLQYLNSRDPAGPPYELPVPVVPMQENQ